MRKYERVACEILLLPASDVVRTSVDINDDSGWTGIY